MDSLIDFHKRFGGVVSLLLFYSSLFLLFYLFSRSYKRPRLSNELKEILLNLPPEEVALLRFVLQHPSGAPWVPCSNPDMLSLSQKGCLIFVRQSSEVRGYPFDQQCQCWPVFVPVAIREYILRKQSELSALWGASRLCIELDIYQENT